jgi:hypothetical protein
MMTIAMQFPLRPSEFTDRCPIFSRIILREINPLALKCVMCVVGVQHISTLNQVRTTI